MTTETKGELIQERQGRVLQLTIKDPGSRNALSPDIYQAGIAAIDTAVREDGIGVVVVSGANGFFCSGGNLHRLQKTREKDPLIPREGVSLFHEWIKSIRRCPKPVIAAVEGSAAGAGFSLALACDLIVSAENARYIMAYVKVGLSPDGGATALLSRALPPQTVSEILFEGGIVSAKRLHQLGVVNRLSAPGQALQDCLDWANQLADGPVSAMGRIKQLVNAAQGNDLFCQLELEHKKFLESLFHEECEEGIAAFFDKRPPKFRIGSAL